MKDTVRLNFEFPREYYPFLKMVLAKNGVSLKDFATQLLVKALEENEDEILASRGESILKNLKEEDLIEWDEATQRAGWQDGKI